MTAARLEAWHGRLLVTTAVMIPVGEGVAFAAMGLFGLLTLVRFRQADWHCLRGQALQPVVAGLGVWLTAGLVAVAIGGEGWLKPSELGRWLPLLLIPAIVVASTSLDARWIRHAVTGFVVALFIASLFALHQVVFNVRPGEFIAREGVQSASQGRIPGRWYSTVAGGFYFHRLKMAHVLLVGIAVMMGRQIASTLSHRRRAVELFVLALFVVTLFLTFARGAVLGAAFGISMCIVAMPRRQRLLTLVGVAVVASLAWTVPEIRQRVESITTRQASAVRATIWSQGVRIIADHPWGIGLGNYPRIVGRYYDVSDPAFTVRTYPHNIVLAAWAETGPLGMLAFVWAWTAFWVGCAQLLWNRIGDRSTRAAAATGVFGTAALWAVGLTHDVLYHPSVAMAFAGMVGVVIALRR